MLINSVYLPQISESCISPFLGGVYKTLLPKAEDFSQALYTFDIGQNDLASGYFHNMSTDQVKAYVPDVLAQFKNVIKVILFNFCDISSCSYRKD